MKRVALVAAVAGLALGAASPVLAQDDPHREGVYGGVNPIAPTDANKVKHKDALAKKTLHWIGFQQQRSATEVFLQAAQPFTIDQRLEGGVLVISISGLTKLGPNVRRPMDTRFFDGPITTITTHARRAHRARRGVPAATAGIDVHLAFRDGKPATGDVRTATEADGMYYAYLSFAGGTGSITPSAPEAPATQPSQP